MTEKDKQIVISSEPPYTVDDLKAEFEEAKKQKRFAFVFGNGINRYASSVEPLSWNDLIRSLWKENLHEDVPKAGNGLSLTEIYDIMCMKQDGEWKDVHKKDQVSVAKNALQRT